MRLERWRLGAEHAGWKFGEQERRRPACLSFDPAGKPRKERCCLSFALSVMLGSLGPFNSVDADLSNLCKSQWPVTVI